MGRMLFLVFVTFCVAALLLPQVSRATPGIFQGKIVQPAHGNVPQGWIFVLSRNHMLRKVEISRTKVVYADTVPTAERVDQPQAALVDGTEVRVTAEQDKAGDWRASRLEIVSLSHSRLRSAAAGTWIH